MDTSCSRPKQPDDHLFPCAHQKLHSQCRVQVTPFSTLRHWPTAKAKRVKSPLRSPTLAPPRHRQRSSRPGALVEFVGQEHKQTKTSADVHPEPKKYIAGYPDCTYVADYVVAPTNKKVKIVEPKLLHAKLQKYSFCRWIARYLFCTVLNSDHWQAGSMYVVALPFVPVVSIDQFLPFSPMGALSALGVRLERAASDLNPSLPIFFLALFYVSSLFPRGIIGAFTSSAHC